MYPIISQQQHENQGLHLLKWTVMAVTDKTPHQDDDQNGSGLVFEWVLMSPILAYYILTADTTNGFSNQESKRLSSWKHISTARVLLVRPYIRTHYY